MPGKLVLPRPRSGGPFLVVAHRGARIHCPENSVAGFRQAIEEGADLLEADVRTTADGQFVCFHDRRLERTSDGAGIVEQQTLQGLTPRRLRTGKKVWPDERVPTLEALALLCPADVYLALDLKSRRFTQRAVCESFLRTVERLGFRQRVILLSFHASHLNAMASVAPEIPAGIVSFRPWPHGLFDVLGPVPFVLQLNSGYVAEAHRRGQFVCPLDTSPEARLLQYRHLGVDAILSDDPGKTVRAALRLG